jgi:DNA-binding NarL/FixJ family response regulator
VSTCELNSQLAVRRGRPNGAALVFSDTGYVHWDRYAEAHAVARKVLKRYGLKTLNGMDAHDFAMNSIMGRTWCPAAVWRDIYDAFRQVYGRKDWGEEVFSKSRRPGRKRRPRRTWQTVYDNTLVSRDPEPFEQADFLRDIKMGPQMRKVAWMLANGLSQKETARWMDVSPSLVCLLVKRLQKALEEHGYRGRMKP